MIEHARKRRAVAAHASLVLAIALLAALALVPGRVWLPPCPVFTLTGLRCPGCGATRALLALLHGDFSAALRSNAAFVFLLPGLISYAAAAYRRAIAPGDFAWPTLTPPILWSTITAVAAFAVARNIVHLP